MADKPKEKPKGIARELVDGVMAVKNPGYIAYRREAEALGEDVMTPAEWTAREKRRQSDDE